MKREIAILTHRAETARVIALYLRAVVGNDLECYPMTYREVLLSPKLMDETDLFLLELISMDSVGPYSEGINAAEKLVSLRKAVLIISGLGHADEIDCKQYWDLAAADSLAERIASMDITPISTGCLQRLRHKLKLCHRATYDSHSDAAAV